MYFFGFLYDIILIFDAFIFVLCMYPVLIETRSSGDMCLWIST